MEKYKDASKYRKFHVLESSCTGKARSFKTQDEAWSDIQHNDKQFYVIEYEALLEEAEAHKKTAARLQTQIDMLISDPFTQRATILFSKLDVEAQNIILQTLDYMLRKQKPTNQE